MDKLWWRPNARAKCSAAVLAASGTAGILRAGLAVTQ